MAKKNIKKGSDKNDPTAESRKQDHIDLALKSQVSGSDSRFYYEPLLGAHPQGGSLPSFKLAGRKMKAPLWVSSMTGGTKWANTINHNLARVCKEFGLGMGLGSCRSLLSSNDHFEDFAVRGLIGNRPLFANIGIAQLETLQKRKRFDLIVQMVEKLEADGLIIHVNPLQEWLQPEGDRFAYRPIDTIKRFLDFVDVRVIVKEVGQGMGYHSLKALLKLPIEAIDFAAKGGTNFAKLELLRSTAEKQAIFDVLPEIGHTAEEMVHLCNGLVEELGSSVKCKKLIISGGIKNFLDGYYLTQLSKLPAVYGQASGFLKHARGDYADLQQHVQSQIEGLELAHALLRVKPRK